MPVVVRYIVKGAMVLYVKGRNRGTNEGVYALTATEIEGYAYDDQFDASR